jgi:aryl-phospho-beta-D-glucosidase BglC (GH1 family)
MEQTVRLRGANVYQQEDSGHPWYPRLVEDDLKGLAKAGANYVNLSVPGPYNVVPPYGRSGAFADRLDEIVRWAEAAGLHVVLSFRTGPGHSEFDITNQGPEAHSRELFTDSRAQAAFIRMWQEVARRYANRPLVVGYDLLVEPHADLKPGTPEEPFRKTWADLAQRPVDAIRKIDEKTPILISPSQYGSVDGLEVSVVTEFAEPIGYFANSWHDSLSIAVSATVPKASSTTCTSQCSSARSRSRSSRSSRPPRRGVESTA